MSAAHVPQFTMNNQAGQEALPFGAVRTDQGILVVTSQRAAYDLDAADGVIDGKYHGQEIAVTAPSTHTAAAAAIADIPPVPAPERKVVKEVEVEMVKAVRPIGMQPFVTKYCRVDCNGVPLPCTCAGRAAKVPVPGPYGYSFKNGNVIPLGAAGGVGNVSVPPPQPRAVAPNAAGLNVQSGASGWVWANGIGIAGGNHNFNYRPLQVDPKTPVAPTAVAPQGSIHEYLVDHSGVQIVPFRSAAGAAQ